MDREALVLYLENVRDLEVAKYCLERKWRREKRDFENTVARFRQADYWATPYYPILDSESASNRRGGIICFVVGCIICFVVGFIMFLSDVTGLGPLCLVIGIVCVVLGLYFIIKSSEGYSQYKDDLAQYNQESERVESHNRKEEEIQKQNSAARKRYTDKWNDKQSWYREENAKLDNLLAQFYNMNLIPLQFRRLSSICYVYDYMSTSQATLESALFSQHMEEGIQRIESKLDNVVSRLENLIYETRCLQGSMDWMIEQNKQMIEKNNQMLESLERNESNTLEAARYAELSANYSKANAYFGLATYLKEN